MYIQNTSTITHTVSVANEEHSYNAKSICSLQMKECIVRQMIEISEWDQRLRRSTYGKLYVDTHFQKAIWRYGAVLMWNQ